jgi:hypothetical protein
MLHQAIEVVGPPSRGAPYPPFDAGAVNESRIRDNMRPKWTDVEQVGDDLYVKWVTQEAIDPSGVQSLVREFKRWHVATEQKGVVHLRVEDRDGLCRPRFRTIK